MTAREATQNAIAAVAAGDMDALARALASRETALRAASPAEQTAALGDGAILSLRLVEFKRSLTAEYARLEQLREGFVNYSGSSRSLGIDLSF